MADVTLAEVNGQVWLVDGLEYIDEMLMGTLADTVSIEFVPCDTRAEVWAMWSRANPQAGGASPWVINPAIVRRIKGVSEQSIRFTAWSAMLTDDAKAIVTQSVGALRSQPAGRLMLRQFAPAANPPGLADLQRLRGQLVAGALTQAGVDPSLLDHETVPSEVTDDAERLDIVTISSPTAS